MLLGTLHKESYLKRRLTRKRRNPYQHHRRVRERQRITRVEKLAKNSYQQILAAQYVEGTRRAKRLELYSGEKLAVIELQPDDSYTITRMHPSPTTCTVVGLRLNQRTGTLT